MKLILIRHAAAEDHARMDFERKLIEKGHLQAQRVATFLDRCAIQPTRILTSPLIRAKETAAHLADTLQCEYGLLEEPRLACGMSPETGCGILHECTKGETVIMVGHAPDCGRFAAYLIDMKQSYNIRFKKATAAIFEIDTPNQGGAELSAFLPASMLKSQEEM